MVRHKQEATAVYETLADDLTSQRRVLRHQTKSINPSINVNDGNIGLMQIVEKEYSQIKIDNKIADVRVKKYYEAIKITTNKIEKAKPMIADANEEVERLQQELEEKERRIQELKNRLKIKKEEDKEEILKSLSKSRSKKEFVPPPLKVPIQIVTKKIREIKHRVIELPLTHRGQMTPESMLTTNQTTTATPDKLCTTLKKGMKKYLNPHEPIFQFTDSHKKIYTEQWNLKRSRNSVKTKGDSNK